MTSVYGESVLEGIHENDPRSGFGCGSKGAVALAFRNGPIEDLHSGRQCAVCSGTPQISHITDEEIKTIMKSAVNALNRLLWLQDCDPAAYNENLALGWRYTLHWDDPFKKSLRIGSRLK